jgi:hypothetical protein
MKYSQITLAVAWENLSGVREKTAVDALLDAVEHYCDGEVIVLEYQERPMLLQVDLTSDFVK